MASVLTILASLLLANAMPARAEAQVAAQKQAVIYFF